MSIPRPEHAVQALSDIWDHTAGNPEGRSDAIYQEFRIRISPDQLSRLGFSAVLSVIMRLVYPDSDQPKPRVEKPVSAPATEKTTLTREEDRRARGILDQLKIQF